ncbi:MAG: hypothetical protein A2Z28_03075 [Chloroflexi bacterium RBG_16_51_9]|nr:MAG: hypothetical protein A2Z28_03075 [Chloroflexi bacterium RBG_16_51_9]
MKSVGFVSAVIYTGISLAAAGLFLLATMSGKHTTVERFGGAGWVFFLSMIILMPIVTPMVKKRLGGD